MKTLLWIDDYRNPFENDWLDFSPIGQNCNVVWVKSYQEAINYLDKNWPDAICLDHDLGEYKSGYDIAKYIINKCLECNLLLPEFSSQSLNPIDRENILSLLNNYKEYERSNLLL